ncbi:F-box/LRR-repeat protein At3g26922 [Medicago truncatula]|uniref:F-box/LRR-repeat protein At3g26922 n=1 Tax=Medicago truncatula TaxID=3880 RepID=UPI000D2F45CE|nr:F-box/LRR-repeat protein At3g26922 [Medicago truncatula]
MKRERHNHNQEKNEDRLSVLPECILLHILSFLDPKEAVQTCILSKSWKNLWKYLPILKLTFRHFKKNPKGFTKFVSQILSLRNDSTALHTLDFHCRGRLELHILERILKYAFSHNVQRLGVDLSCNIPQFPLSFFSCHTLTSLDLRIHFFTLTNLFPDSLDLPALTNLSLQGFLFCVGDDGRANPFSTLNKLNSLIINRCASNSADNPLLLLDLLVELANVESLTISSFTLEVLSLVHDLSKVEFNFLHNLKSLKVNTYQQSIPDGILNFLLQNAPSTKLSSNIAVKILTYWMCFIHMFSQILEVTCV